MNINFSFNYIKEISIEEDAYWFIFQGENILTQTEGNITLPTLPLLIRGRNIPHLDIEKVLHIGELNGTNCYATFDHTESELIPDTEWVPLRMSYGKFNKDMFLIYGRARHLLLWAQNNRFCGQCGHPLELKSDERCLQCPSCGFCSYPRISPAVIVSIEKEGKILLARATRFPGKMYSVLAGFVEPGESLEECIKREIKEEIGIEVKNIKYFSSQPWPFPDSLMIAFTSEYAGGELSIDKNELVDAGWYSPEEFPIIPGKLSIARALIDYYVQRNLKFESIYYK
ncbi:MAG: NAD(+) diphosphatase [Smithella sp.]